MSQAKAEIRFNGDAPRVMTLVEVAEYLRVHSSTVYRLLKKKALPAYKIGSDWRFNVEDIDRYRLNASQLAVEHLGAGLTD